MTGLAQNIKFKYNKDMLGLFLLKPILFFIIADMSLWAYKRKLPFVITRTIDEKIDGVSKFDQHAEGRACDVSVKQWDIDSIDAFIHHFNNMYREYAAMSSRDGVARLIPPINHAGNENLHFHIQIRNM